MAQHAAAVPHDRFRWLDRIRVLAGAAREEVQLQAERLERRPSVDGDRYCRDLNCISTGPGGDLRRMKRAAFVVALLLLSTACSGLISHDAPRGQAPLTNLELASFKQQFNSAPGVRLIVLLSPT